MRRISRTLALALLATLVALGVSPSTALGASTPLLASGDYVLFSPPTVFRTCTSDAGVTRISVEVPYDTVELRGGAY